MRLYPLWLVFDAVFGKLHKVTNYPVVRHLFSSISRKQHAHEALVITRFRCSLAFSGKLMRFAPSDNLFILK